MTSPRRSSQEQPNRALMTERIWRVRLGAAAEVDFANILKWATENFGARQSRVYRDTLVQSIGELADGSRRLRLQDPRRDHGRSSHAPHFATGSSWESLPDVPGRVKQYDRIVRILHHRMDLQRHVPSAPDDSAE